MAAIWSEIPEELVSKFAERLVCLDDLIRFRSVCKQWRSISTSEKEKKKKKPYSPLIMLANAENDMKDGKGIRSFLIPYDMKSFNLAIPKAQGRRCWGSPYGWLVSVGVDLDIALLNPLTGAHLSLPPQSILQKQSHPSLAFTPSLDPDRIIALLIRKFTLGWHSSSQTWLVMAIFGTAEEVAFSFIETGTENSNSSWTSIEHTIDSEDIILFQDKIYIIAFGGTLKVYDINHNDNDNDADDTTPRAIRIASSPDVNDSDTFYLVEIGGNLHFVARYYDPAQRDEILYGSSGFKERGQTDEYCYVTTSFRVWRFDFSKTEWAELDNLGEYALFLGNHTSFSLSTITYPDFSKNSIYFTDDRYHKYNSRSCDLGVYDYGERIVKPFDFDIANMGAFSEFSRPTFFMPTL